MHLTNVEYYQRLINFFCPKGIVSKRRTDWYIPGVYDRADYSLSELIKLLEILDF